MADEYEKMMKEMQKKMMEQMGIAMPEGFEDAYAEQAMAQQAAAAQMTGMSPDALAALMSEAMGEMNFDFEADAEEDDSDLIAFIEANPVPAEFDRLLPIGAFLIGTWGEPYETLAITSSSEEVAYALENGWGIESREEGLEMLESLMKGRHANSFKGRHEAMKAGRFDEVDGEDVEDYNLSVEGITEALSLPKNLVDNCTTLLAWDLERVGYLARLFVKIGYISEEEAWDWIQKAAAETKNTFNSWEEYIVSLLLGRGFAMGVAPEPYMVALDLLTDRRDFLESRPISNL
ncbi:DUF1266 domain-containing protein [Methanimicrococcus blatticola]|uniref:Uncharacterized protein DUF1266 n=1 Tax=Methanimicrococcus blatticola TaxID=91560 RepID=A0A484F7X1_9EURY|nr:DUF1266 domain-containing protein [Methanimicrococcus blatticola]MBZ3935153.1 DUF1266 domain-containing protein [Methanimicrococcus blatticola]MCC2508750.1 DUF1266 domain-containing protein [Methanimicrococcus blatticola]TDQ71215.1 uncharacterized protein DUF1266 [Methanimicrococcus blatticola]